MNRHKITPFFFLFVLVLKSSSAQDTLMTEQKAIEIALKNNYAITISRNETEMAKNNNSTGNAGMLPQLSLNAADNIANYNTKQQYSSGLEVNKDNVGSESFNANAALSWTIFDGLKMFATKNKLQELQAQGELNLKIQIENTIAEVIQAYYSIIQQQQLVKASQEEIVVSEERAKIADRKFANGSGGKLDLLQAKVDLNAQRSALLKLQTALEEAKNNLNLLLAQPAETKLNVTDTVIIAYRPAYDQLKTTVMERNNSLLFSARSINIARKEVNEIQGLRYPKISLLGNYVFTKTTNDVGFSLLNQNTGFNYGFTATMPLFNGFTISTQVKNAKLNLLNNELQFDFLKMQVSTSLINAFRQFEDNMQVLKLEEENIEYARESMNIALERFKVGLSNSIELKDAQKSFEDAMSRLVAARYNAKVSETGLMKLNGDLVK